MNMRFRAACRGLAALVLALCFAAAPAGAADAGKSYVNGIDANYPPFGFVNEQGVPSGFDVDSMNWIAKKMGFTVTHQPMDWDGIIPALLAKKIDMVCSGMSVSPERLEVVVFSEPYWNIRKVFVVREGASLTPETIRTGDVRLGVQRGTNEAELLQQEQKAKGYTYKLRFYDSAPLAVEDLLNGRIDAAAMDSAPAEDAMRKGKAIKEAGEFAKGDVFAVAMRKDDAELARLVNEGYRLLMADPYWKELQAKYFGNN